MNALKERSLKNSMLKAVIVGAGGIGAAYDSIRRDAGILTHAHAYRSSPGVGLVGFYDADPAKAKAAAKAWKTKSFSSLKEMMWASPDIVSICVPDIHHEKVLREVIAYRPKAIFCEKPLTVDLKASRQIIAECRKKGIALTVNYSRRFCPEIVQLQKEIRNGKYGKALNAVCVYTKGIRHTGSHALDLIHFFFGKITSSQVLRSQNDWSKEDLTIDAFLTAQNCPAIHLAAGNAKHYSVFEIELLFEKARIILQDSGRRISTQTVEAHSQYPGFRILSKPRIQETRLSYALKFAVSQIAKSVKVLSSGDTALDVQQVCEDLIKKAGRRGQ